MMCGRFGSQQQEAHQEAPPEGAHGAEDLVQEGMVQRPRHAEQHPLRPDDDKGGRRLRECGHGDASHPTSDTRRINRFTLCAGGDKDRYGHSEILNQGTVHASHLCIQRPTFALRPPFALCLPFALRPTLALHPMLATSTTCARQPTCATSAPRPPRPSPRPTSASASWTTHATLAFHRSRAAPPRAMSELRLTRYLS